MIERSTGIMVHGYNPGGGHSGYTEALDALVARAAELLAETFGGDVVIRFNSDRKSGKAFLRVPQGKGRWADSGVGLGGWLRPDGELVVETLLDRDFAALDRLQVHYWNGGHPVSQDGDRYDSRYFATTAAGLKFLAESVDRAALDAARSGAAA